MNTNRQSVGRKTYKFLLSLKFNFVEMRNDFGRKKEVYNAIIYDDLTVFSLCAEG